MATRTTRPPALAALVEAGLSLARRAPSGRILFARAGGILEPEALPPALRKGFEREVEAARAAVCVPLERKEVEKTLKEAWGRAPAKVLDDFDPEPIALTPAAQVHRGEVDGTPVAIKVRRPGVERSVRNDLALLDVLATPLRVAFPRLDAGAVLRDQREQALDELDFENEASTQRRIARALRDVPGVTVPRPHLDLSTPEVLVTDLAPGTTLADGARPGDPGRAARSLIAAFRAAALDAGLAPVDLRASHVVVQPDGTLALLGLGVARPVDRDRAAQGLEALQALLGGDADRFAGLSETSGVLDGETALEAHTVLRDVLGPFSHGRAQLHSGALRDVLVRAREATPALARLATATSPTPQDLALGRMLGQLAAVLARFDATEDWVALTR